MHNASKRVLAGIGIVAVTALAGCAVNDSGETTDGPQIRIGWTPPDITGVFQTATDYFEKAADEANAAGFDVEIISRSPATHTDFSDQAAIVEDFITQGLVPDGDYL